MGVGVYVCVGFQISYPFGMALLVISVSPSHAVGRGFTS